MSKTAADKFVAEIAKAVAAQNVPQPKGPDGKKDMVNSEGGVLMCECTFPKGKDLPNPMCITLNDEIRWVKRGEKVLLPWYVVVHMLNLIQRQYRQERMDNGKYQTIGDDVVAEPFQFSEIDPAPGQHRVGERPPEPADQAE